MQRAAAGPGPLALQAPPRSLKISPVKLDETSDPMSHKNMSHLCFGCGGIIHDRWILRVEPDFEWHAACLKCAECQQFLDESSRCFVRDDKIYCKRDYDRLFGTKCEKCSQSFNKNDFYMRARNKIYHIECFRCSACTRQLRPGDEFALRHDGLFCKHDHEVLEGEKLCSAPGVIPGNENNNNASLTNNNHHLHPNDGSMSDSGSESGSHKAVGGARSSGGTKGGGGSDGKPTRVRTVLNEKQLQTLRNCYAANPRPDALMKEQLVEMTGLSPRVIRVWFQNKRCKDKKKTIAMKQQQLQQEKDGRKLGFGGMHGIPMVASSPVRHESPIGITPQEVLAYQPPWKALSDFALNTDLERLDPNAPSFHHLVSQDMIDTNSDDSFIDFINTYQTVPVQSVNRMTNQGFGYVEAKRTGYMTKAFVRNNAYCSVKQEEIVKVDPALFVSQYSNVDSHYDNSRYHNCWQFGATRSLSKSPIVDNSQLSVLQNGDHSMTGNVGQVEALGTLNLPPTPPYDKNDIELANNQMVINGMEHCAQTQTPRQNGVLVSTESANGSYNDILHTTWDDDYDRVEEILKSMNYPQTLPDLKNVISDWFKEI